MIAKRSRKMKIMTIKFQVMRIVLSSKYKYRKPFFSFYNFIISLLTMDSRNECIDIELFISTIENGNALRNTQTAEYNLGKYK